MQNESVIRTKEETTNEIASQIKNKLQEVTCRGCELSGSRRVKAENDCGETYQKGIEQGKKYCEHVQNAVQFMENVNRLLQNADENVRKSNLGN